MSMTRRAALAGIGAAATGAIMRPASAQRAYPAGIGRIKVVVPFAPGGGSDLIARLLADGLSRRWGVSAVLENVPGGAATTGIGRVANGPKDGSQILILPLPYVTLQSLMSHLPYDSERDIVPLVQLTQQPSLMCVKKNLPVGSVKEFIDYAKARPGKLNYGSGGVGTPAHLLAEYFKKQTGTDMKHVPYKGSAPAQNDLVGGHLDVMFDNAAAIIGLVRAGSVKALAVTAPKRSALIPEFPTVADVVPGFGVMGWLGAAVAGGTPSAIQDAIQSACADLLKEKATIERLANVVSEPVGGKREDFLRLLNEERARWGSLIKDLGIKA
jgi:tripartite-type tricarboxylate transporter receptor subunit TctC